MRYIDTGSRDPAQALGTWLRDELSEPPLELRCQAGFFSADALGFFVSALTAMKASNRTVRVIIGSNDQSTVRQDVLDLLEVTGIPRTGAALGIVSYSGGAFFHPKTYHLRRMDGTQCAYVGSANLTGAGAASLHVEAGLIVDTRDGDAEEVLGRIAAAVDEWFNSSRDGFFPVTGPETVDELVAEGVLALLRPPPPAGETGAAVGAGDRSRRPSLRRLIPVPRLRLGRAQGMPPQPAVPEAAEAERRPGFPDYLLFEPGSRAPTSGPGALSGRPLPIGAVGIIFRLNKDSVRGFAGGGGTANMSLPLTTVATLRFGVNSNSVAYPDRPRAEYPIRIRYTGREYTFAEESIDTSVMAYGYLEGEKGNKDIRLVVRRPPVVALTGKVMAVRLDVPTVGDFALLEWPSAQRPEFRLTFLEPGSTLFQQAEQLFQAAVSAGQMAGDAACWLPPGLSPPWPDAD